MTAAKIVSDAITIGIIYARIARPTSRATSVIFSQYALIKEIDNKIYFMIQVSLHIKSMVYLWNKYIESVTLKILALRAS